MSSEKNDLGLWGEKVAVFQLEKIGFKVIENNFHTNYGEIDLIARENDELVFIEVKTRQNSFRGTALEQISKTKQKKIMLTAAIYLQRKNLLDEPYRIDIVTLDKKENGNWHFCLFRNAVNLF